MSLLLDLECSARHRGTFVTNRSAGPRSDIDHLAVREEVCSEVLRKCASDVGFSVVGASTETFRVRRITTRTRVSYKYLNGTRWVPLLPTSIVRMSLESWERPRYLSTW